MWTVQMPLMKGTPLIIHLFLVELKEEGKAAQKTEFVGEVRDIRRYFCSPSVHSLGIDLNSLWIHTNGHISIS